MHGFKGDTTNVGYPMVQSVHGFKEFYHTDPCEYDYNSKIWQIPNVGKSTFRLNIRYT